MGLEWQFCCKIAYFRYTAYRFSAALGAYRIAIGSSTVVGRRQAGVEISLPPSTEGQNGFVKVPTHKRLVIEYVSGQAFLPSGQKALFSVIVSLQGQPTGTSHYLESTAVGAFGGQDCFQCGRPVRLYADGGTTVMLRTDRDAPSGTGISRMTLSGHLIDTP